MNESTLTQLMIIVERAVRPVRASAGHKRKVREELLAHVTAVFEEEARNGDEPAALQRTAQRFGAPEELTPQLQAAVPAGDALEAYVESLLGLPSRESPLRLAILHGLVITLVCTASLVVIAGTIGPRDGWRSLERWPALFAPVFMGFLVACASLITRGTIQALFRPNGPAYQRVVALLVAAWLLVPAVVVAACALLEGVFLPSLAAVGPLLLSSLLAPLALLLTVAAWRSSILYHEEWARLPIEVKSPTPSH